jgi:hypothetical protein
VDGQRNEELYTTCLSNPATETIKAIHNLALWFISLEQLSFTQVGSPTFDHNGDIVVGPMMDRILPSYIPPHYTGPFRNAKAYYLAVIDAILQQTADGVRYPAATMKDAEFVFTELRQLVEACSEMEEEPSHIVHDDARGDHIRVDEVGEVVGLIDWQWLV